MMDANSHSMDASGLVSSRIDRRLWEAAQRGELPAAMADAFEMAQIAKTEHLTFETIMCLTDPVEAILGSVESLNVVSSNGNHLVKIPHADGDFVLGCWATESSGVFQLSGSVPTTDRRWKRINTAVSGAPDIMRCFLDEATFRTLAVDSVGSAPTEVIRMTAWRQSDSSSLNRSWQAKSGHRRYTPLEIFDLARSEGTSVRSLTVMAENLAHCHLRRTSGSTFYSGDIRAFVHRVLEPLARFSGERLSLLADRTRVVNEPLRPPVSIALPESVFVSGEDTSRLRTLIEDIPKLSVAVLHGNPYLHLMVADHSDGSTFDVVVTDPASVDIYPSFRSTAPALSRLAQRIAEHFSSSSIREAIREESFSLEDLVGV